MAYKSFRKSQVEDELLLIHTHAEGDDRREIILCKCFSFYYPRLGFELASYLERGKKSLVKRFVSEVNL